jgi:DNA gyrase/topoisomerase IV subunit A
MATKPKKPATDYSLHAQGQLIEDVEIGAFTENALRIYGEEVNLNRSVPDFRDGLKPVARRILWALQGLPKDQLLKTARLIGEVLGKFHPHGDASISGAVTTAVTSSTNAIVGVGNWGSLIDPVGASRYTNVQMSAFGKTFFHRDYTPLTALVPNYDGKDKEPLTLPALLPNLLLNGAEGIGLGLNTRIPAFTPTSILPVLADMAEGATFEAKDLAKKLVFYHPYGGETLRTRENFKRITDFFSGTSGTVAWTSPFEVDRDKKQILISKFGPEINPIRLIEEKVKPLTEVSQVHSGKGVSYVIQVRRDLNFNEFDAFVEKFRKLVNSSISYQVYVTVRTLSKEDSTKYQTRFANVPIPKLMQMWVKYRIALEARSIAWRLSEAEKQLAYLRLLIRACDALDVIFAALRKDDPKSHLISKLKLTDEEADTILNLRVKQLSKLDQSRLEKEVKDVQVKIKSLKALKPNLEVAKFLNNAASCFSLEKHDCATQWTLK